MEDNTEYNKLVDLLNMNEMNQLLLALDTVDENPHGNDFETDDRDIESNYQDFEQEKKQKEINDLSNYPDYSDNIINDYIMSRLKGIEQAPPMVIDLDTAPDYVDFVNLSIKNMLEYENLFNEQSQFERIKQLLTNE